MPKQLMLTELGTAAANASPPQPQFQLQIPAATSPSPPHIVPVLRDNGPPAVLTFITCLLHSST